MLAHGNKSPRVDMSLHLDTLSLFRAIQCLIFFLRAKQISSKYQFDRTGLEHTIYHTTRGEHANHIPPKWFYEYTREIYCSGPLHVGVIMHIIHVIDPWVKAQCTRGKQRYLLDYNSIEFTLTTQTIRLLNRICFYLKIGRRPIVERRSKICNISIGC